MTSPLSSTAFVFPGQGSQAPGMGKDIAAASARARALFEQADSVLGYSLSKLCFEGPAEELGKTNITQPALYVTSCATLEALRERGVGAPAAVAGHSLGEYSALYAAGVFDFVTGLKLVHARGEAMANAGGERKGAMAAVLGLDGAKVAELCKATSDSSGKFVHSANFNDPTQTVISGDAEAVAAVSEELKKAGAKRVLPLAVSGAFHSPLVAPAAEVMRARLAEATFAAPKLLFVNNVDAKALTDPAEIRDSLVRQITGCVQWVRSVQLLAERGMKRYVEVGSGKVLSGLVGRIAKDSETQTTESAAKVESVAQLLNAP